MQDKSIKYTFLQQKMNATCSEKPPSTTYRTRKVKFNSKRSLVLIKCLSEADGVHTALIRVGKGITKGWWEMC